MKKFDYIIIGGGMTGSSAAMEIRKNDPDGSIAMFSKEKYGPYNRPPLTKGLWDGKKVDDILRNIDKYQVELFLEDPIIKISRESKTLTDVNDTTYQYGKLLLATGGHPIQLPDTPEGVITYRTRADYERLRSLTQNKSKFCVIGGGFIGSEIAAALNKQGKQVTMIFPEVGISGLRFPDDLAEFLNDYYQEKGVRVLNGYLVNAIQKDGGTFLVQYKMQDNEESTEETFDGVIVGIGIKPNVQLAEDAGLSTGDGIIVNEFLQTDDPDIFAAGDVANFLNIPMDERMRVEHEDNANKMGSHAGKNMSGEMSKYDHFPFFYSDLFDLGYEAVGVMSKDYEILEDWVKPFKKGTIFYLKENKIRGLIFWNLWGKVDQGCEIIKQGKEYPKSELLGMFLDD